MFTNIKYIILLMAGMSSKLFFSVASVLGFNYEGSGESFIYILYTAVISLFVVVIYFFSVLQKQGSDKRELKLFIIPIFILISYLSESIILGKIDSISIKSLSIFFLWSFPAILSGLYLTRNNIFIDAFKYFELLMIVFTLSALYAVIFPFVEGKRFETQAGASYQAMSYVAAIAFGLNLYFIFLGKNKYRFAFANNNIYYIFSICILPVQLVSVILPGGRGAAILSIVYIFLIPALFYKSIDARSRNKIIFILVCLLLIGGVYFPALIGDNEIAADGFQRAFQFLGANKLIDWEGSSGRDVIYNKAVELILLKPIFGYGLFSFSDQLGATYSHNLVLDLLLGGGIILISIVLFMFGFLVGRVKSLIRTDKQFSIVVVIFTYSLVSLMFSGTYLHTTELWFTIAIIFTWRPKLRILGSQK